MDRWDWLLLLLAAVPRRPVDPVRVQKGMFLLAMEGGLPPGERYAFEPYAYGPMSRELYREVRELREGGLFERVAVEHASWDALRVTPTGLEQARRLHEIAVVERPAALDAIKAIRAEIDGLSFAGLLARVYARYPEYATRSVFRQP